MGAWGQEQWVESGVTLVVCNGNKKTQPCNKLKGKSFTNTGCLVVCSCHVCWPCKSRFHFTPAFSRDQPGAESKLSGSASGQDLQVHVVQFSAQESLWAASQIRSLWPTWVGSRSEKWELASRNGRCTTKQVDFWGCRWFPPKWMASRLRKCLFSVHLHRDVLGGDDTSLCGHYSCFLHLGPFSILDIYCFFPRVNTAVPLGDDFTQWKNVFKLRSWWWQSRLEWHCMMTFNEKMRIFRSTCLKLGLKSWILTTDLPWFTSNIFDRAKGNPTLHSWRLWNVFPFKTRTYQQPGSYCDGGWTGGEICDFSPLIIFSCTVKKI